MVEFLGVGEVDNGFHAAEFGCNAEDVIPVADRTRSRVADEGRVEVPPGGPDQDGA